MHARWWWIGLVSLVACHGRNEPSHADETPGSVQPKRTNVEGNAVAADLGAPATSEVTPLPPEDVEIRAADDGVVYGRYYGIESDKPGPIVLLFHQAGSNAAEYQPIAPRLQALGYAALAIDQRSGGRRFGRDNATVEARGDSTGFGAAYPDLEAALAWAQERHPRVVAWGSSYSAALVFRLGAEHGDELHALLAFSPGEYFEDEGQVAGWASRCALPVFVSSAPGKEVAAAEALASAAGGRAQHHVPKKGVHGSSMLRPDRNPDGYEAIWSAVETFLEREVTRARAPQR